MYNTKKSIAYYHLPGLFEFYELYREFLPLFRKHREYFMTGVRLAQFTGAPADCIWGGMAVPDLESRSRKRFWN